MSACRHGMPSPVNCFECMEDGNLEPSPPRSTQVRSHAASAEGEHDDSVHAVIVTVGGHGISIRELVVQTGLRARVLENVIWRLDVKQSRVHRVPGSKPQRYAAGGTPG